MRQRGWQFFFRQFLTSFFLDYIDESKSLMVLTGFGGIIRFIFSIL